MLAVDIACGADRGGVTAAFTAPGGVTVIFGPSGAGKTTVLESVAGLVRPVRARIRHGDILFADTEAGVHMPPARRHIGYVPQDSLLFPHMSVAKNLAYGGRSVDVAETAALCEVSDLVSRMPRTLSGGERRRVALARALAAAPRLLLLDEPLSGLDPPRRKRLLAVIERVRDETGIPILYVSHFAEEAIRLADHAVMMDEGRVIAAGTPADIFADDAAQRHFGPLDEGSIIEGRVTAADGDGLYGIAFEGGLLKIAGAAPPMGSTLRVRVLARDVSVALSAPEATSLLNILPAEIRAIRRDEGDAVLGLDLGGTALRARITAHSAAALGLAQGQSVYAMIKAVAVARRH